MTDYSDLVERLRRDGIAARDTLKCAECAPTVDPEDALEAADAIELLQRELKCANELWEQQKELALEYLADIEKANERIAEREEEIDRIDEWAKGFIEKADARIVELEAALKPFADASDLHLGSDDMSIAFRIIIGNLRQARKVLENA